MRTLRFLPLLALAGLTFATPALAQIDISGSWTLQGKDEHGDYRGTATAVQSPDKSVVIRLEWTYVNAPTEKGAARIEARLAGLTLRGKRITDAGATGVLQGQGGKTYDIVYGLNLGPLTNGSRIRLVSGRYNKSKGRDRLSAHDPSGGQPPPPPPGGQDSIVVPAKLMAVPGTPEAGQQPVTIKVAGSAAQLKVDGPGRLLRGGQVAAESGATIELAPGEHALKLEGTRDGDVTLTLSRGGQSAATGKSTVTVERTYLLLFGYQGAEVNYLEGDLSKTVSNIVPHLGQGFTKVEDGKSYDQSKIDGALNDPNTPRKVIVDWATTRADLMAYLKRGTVRGLTWGSHGYMEPFPGCPDSEIDMFESRVWSSMPADPAVGEVKNFMREWRDALAPSVKTHGKLDFVLMHSCCTGGIGSYRDEVWHYINAETKARATALLGDPLPLWDKLRYSSFNDLKAQAGFVQTYDGPSYFGMWDVSWGPIRDSLKPGN